MPTHEHTINVALGEVLADLRPHSWRVVSEQSGRLSGGGRPDILIEEASQWPAAVEVSTPFVNISQGSGLSLAYARSRWTRLSSWLIHRL